MVVATGPLEPGRAELREEDRDAEGERDADDEGDQGRRQGADDGDPGAVLILVDVPDARGDEAEAEFAEGGQAAIDHRAEDARENDQHQKGRAEAREAEEPVEARRWGSASGSSRARHETFLRESYHSPIRFVVRSRSDYCVKTGWPDAFLISLFQVART